MWCDNCLLLFPLEGGAMALALFIALYSTAGSVFLFMRGALLYFTYPEPQIYGGIGIAVAIICLLCMIAMSNSSYTWTRVIFYLSPFLLIIVAIRAGLMIFRLNYYQGNIIWECNHGGQLWNATLAADPSYSAYSTPLNPDEITMPAGFCNSGFHTVYLAFAFSVCVDWLLQLYLYFMMWRYKAKLEEYFSFKQTVGGIYTA